MKKNYIYNRFGKIQELLVNSSSADSNGPHIIEKENYSMNNSQIIKHDQDDEPHNHLTLS